MFACTEGDPEGAEVVGNNGAAEAICVGWEKGEAVWLTKVGGALGLRLQSDD